MGCDARPSGMAIAAYKVLAEAEALGYDRKELDVVHTERVKNDCLAEEYECRMGRDERICDRRIISEARASCEQYWAGKRRLFIASLKSINKMNALIRILTSESAWIEMDSRHC